MYLSVSHNFPLANVEGRVRNGSRSIGGAIMTEIENRYTKMVHIKNEIQILLEQNFYCTHSMYSVHVMQCRQCIQQL